MYYLNACINFVLVHREFNQCGVAWISAMA